MVFEPVSFGFAVGAIAKLIGGKALAAKGVAALSHAGSSHAVAQAGMHAVHAAGHAGVLTTANAIVVVEGVGGMVLGAVGMAVMEKLLRGRNVGPTGEKIATKVSFLVEHDVIEYKDADEMIGSVEKFSESTKQSMNRELGEILARAVKQESN
jgi:hypothetical protein